MSSQYGNYVSKKHTESGYALLKAASLPYESFSERNGSVVPALMPTPEAQLTDVITMDATRFGADTYIEILNDPLLPLWMTSPGPVNYFFSVDQPEVTFALEMNFEKPVMGAMPDFGIITSSNAHRVVMINPNDDRPHWLIESPIGCSVDIQLQAKSRYDLECTINFLAYAGGGWVVIGTLTPAFANVWTGGSYAVPIGTTAISYEIVVAPSTIIDEPSIGFLGRMTFSGSAPQSVRLTAHWGLLNGFNWPFLRGLPDISKVRRICQDALLTYTGSDLNNGGKVASGLAPYEWSPDIGDTAFSAVAALRHDRYDDRLKTGTHVTWRSHELRDLLPQDYRSYAHSSSKIVMGVYYDNPEAAARLRTFAMFGFYSTNPIIGEMIWTPAITPAMMEALTEYYANFPTCTDNPEHVLRKSLKTAGAVAKNVITRLLNHDDAIAALAASMGQPELAIGIKAAGAINRSLSANKQPKSQTPKSTTQKKKKK